VEAALHAAGFAAERQDGINHVGDIFEGMGEGLPAGCGERLFPAPLTIEPSAPPSSAAEPWPTSSRRTRDRARSALSSGQQFLTLG
jgi:hypothetical protein